MNSIKIISLKLVLVLLSLGFFYSCESTTPYMDKAYIVGIDYSLCVCCGGFLVVIGDEADTENLENYYRADQLPESFQNDLTQFNHATTDQPVRVELDWNLNEGLCTSFNRINIDRMRLLDD